MKKSKIFCLIAIVILAILILSCSKKEDLSLTNLQAPDNSDKLQQNEATWIYSGDSKKPRFCLKFFIGHTASECGGKCIKLFGEWGHVDCVGFGNTCNHVVFTSIESGEGLDDYILTLIEPDALGASLEFLFPDRSLLITNPLNNTDLWLNIPEQYLIRETEEDFFEILGAWFSVVPEFENR
jgi:hypothetical protein